MTGRTGQTRTCDQSLTEAVESYGLTGDDISDIFNVFMNSELHADGTFTRKAPTAEKGDHIDLLAEMDILAAVCACPAPTLTNDYLPKPLGVMILQ